ncbi:hypothetical protein Fmac_014991 [Flemingia macrophylla]|uniref:Uncharacterized protein n=1 Tax=Flemingia macrophylla TaxID=520843 RepID=A0ABD1MDA8_9FABA
MFCQRPYVSKSITDKDVNELKTYIELGFGFDSSPIDDDRCLSDTLPPSASTLPSTNATMMLSSSDCDNTPSPLSSPHSSVFITSKVATFVPKGELDGEIGDAHMAMQARCEWGLQMAGNDDEVNEGLKPLTNYGGYLNPRTHRTTHETLTRDLPATRRQQLRRRVTLTASDSDDDHNPVMRARQSRMTRGARSTRATRDPINSGEQRPIKDLWFICASNKDRDLALHRACKWHY